MWDKIKGFLAERLSEASTARALTLLFGFIGWKVSPENAEAIATVVVLALGFFGIAPDKKKTEAEMALEAEALKAKRLADAMAIVEADKAGKEF